MIQNCSTPSIHFYSISNFTPFTNRIEGITGTKAIYKTRGESQNDPTLLQLNPKRLSFVFDLSASMMRFNGHDGRLDRSLECAVCKTIFFIPRSFLFAKMIYYISDNGSIQRL
jgi:hypothetical protein